MQFVLESTQLESTQLESTGVAFIFTYRCRMFICPRKLYFCHIKCCISICKFLKNIFWGTKFRMPKERKKIKPLSKNRVELQEIRFVPRNYFALYLLVPRTKVRFDAVSNNVSKVMMK